MDKNIENVRTIKAFDPNSRYQTGGEVDTTDTPSNPLDSAELRNKLSQLESWFEQERSIQAENRYQMALDQDFYDGLQYSEEDAQILMERGQAPLVFNEVKPTLDWIIGTERRTKFDFNVLPRTDDKVEMASIKRDVLKYINDVNHITSERSQAFKESAICGVSWTEDGVRGDNQEDPVFSKMESWRNVWYDSNSKRLDLGDARYLFRRKVIDLDVALAMFPQRQIQLRASAMDQDLFSSQYGDDDYYLGQPLKQNTNGTTPVSAFSRHAGILSGGNNINHRLRVEAIEAWTRMPGAVSRMRGDTFNGEKYDPKNTNHVNAVRDGVVSLYDRMEMVIEVSLFCKGAMLWNGPSPYKHNRFSLTPLWCYRRGRDNAPYGVVRNIRDPQEDLNKRASKALFILSSKQIIAEEGAVDDWDELREEVARPDGVIVHKKGKSLEIRDDVQLAEEHMKLMDRDANQIRHSGGVTDENLGLESNARSGKAIIARQTQGSVVTAEIFDNYLLSFQIQGENLLSLAEQYYTDEKVIRLTGSKKGLLTWRKINVPQDNGTYLNDITQDKADFIVDEMDYRESVRQAMFEQMMDMLSKMPPEVALKLLDLVFEFSDMQGKDQIVKRIRQINGQVDPDEKLTPDEVEAAQQKQRDTEIAKQIEVGTAVANLKLLEAKVANLIEQNKKLDAERLTTTVTAMYEAMQAAGIVATVPGTAPVADEILRSAGYQEFPGGQNPQIPPAGQQPGAQPPVQQQPDMRPPPPLQGDGAAHGIETVRNDGSDQSPVQ